MRDPRLLYAREIGHRLRDRRRRNEYNQQTLSKVTQIRRSRISEIENAKTDLTLFEAMQLKEALNLDMGFFEVAPHEGTEHQL